MQVTLANWRTAPFNRWAFHHVRELIPSADIPNDPRRTRPLQAQRADFSSLRVEAFIRETDTDGLAIVHRGRLVFERYGNGMTDETPHILMSVSKSLLGVLAEILAEQLLAVALAIGEGGVEEVAAERHAAIERGEGPGVLRAGPPAHAPHPVADVRHLPPEPTERAIPHIRPS